MATRAVPSICHLWRRLTNWSTGWASRAWWIPAHVLSRYGKAHTPRSRTSRASTKYGKSALKPLRISPLNTRFVAALYVAGGVGVLWAAIRARNKFETRLFVVGFGLVTGMILVLLLMHQRTGLRGRHAARWLLLGAAGALTAAAAVCRLGLRHRPARAAQSGHKAPEKPARGAARACRRPAARWGDAGSHSGAGCWRRPAAPRR